MATNAGDLDEAVETIFNTAFDERDSQQVPKSEDVVLKDGAVKVDATFLYADLAGSAKLSSACPWSTTAKIIRAYLDCSTRLIRARGGHIRSFDGDRVMGVFMGESKNSDAADCGRQIHYTVLKIIAPKARAHFKSICDNDITIKNAVGIANGEVRAVRAGIRNNNDLIWIGKAASLSAKLSDVRESPYSTFISAAVYDMLRKSSKYANGDGVDMWEKRTFKFAGEDESIYRSSWWKKP